MPASVNVSEVAPVRPPPLEIFVPFRRHWYASGDVPDAVAANWMVLPAYAVRDAGWVEIEGGEMVGRESGDHRQIGQHRFEREHGLDAFTSGKHVGGTAEAHAMAEQLTERTTRIGERSFRGALAVEPGAMDAGDAAIRVGHGSEQPRPGLASGIAVGAIPERGMKPERRPVERRSDAARPQIGFGASAGNELASAKQPPRGFAGSGG